MSSSKRLFDLFWAILGLLILWPLFLIVALLIRFDDRGPIFFRQERVGHRGKPFRIWKFRTMVIDAEQRGKPLTVGQDTRVTRIGNWLRKFKLDELPQLFNVLRGEMSLVGARPEVSRYVALYTPEQRRVLELVPGITDPASVKYRDESDVLGRADDPEKLYIQKLMPEKIRINLEYSQRATLLSDLFVIVNTIVKIAQ